MSRGFTLSREEAGALIRFVVGVRADYAELDALRPDREGKRAEGYREVKGLVMRLGGVR